VVNEYFDRTLVADFPQLYASRNVRAPLVPLAFGFECDDGWERLIRELSYTLEFLNDTVPVWVKAVQVKEKFGTLRFYVDIAGDKPWRDLIYDLIAYAEARSSWTCESCGEPGKARGGSWVRTLCDSCHDELLTRKEVPVAASKEY
jgi:hypothetical protein